MTSDNNSTPPSSNNSSNSFNNVSRYPRPPPFMAPPNIAYEGGAAAAATMMGRQHAPLSRGGMRTNAPPAPPHVTMENIPQLRSAPPSGNGFFASFDDMMQPFGTEYQQQHEQDETEAMMDFQMPPPPAMPPPHSYTTATIPHPPPPPPPPHATYASPLPPPPVMSTSKKLAPGATSPTRSFPPPPPPKTSSSVSSSSSASAGRPPPPPPPPPTQVQQQAYQPPTEEPPALPITNFLPKELSLLAKRQSHLPILVLATESAHKLAWKNRLRLTDLFEGLAQDLDISDTVRQRPIPPFRSVSRSLSLNWDDVNMTFVRPEDVAQPMDYQVAQDVLQEHAKLLNDDGNLQEELDLLEDQIDNLLQEDDNSDQEDNHDPSHHYSVMDHHNRRQQHVAQVTKDAFQLTSPLNIPWLVRYRHALDVSTNHMQHEFFSCPALCLLVCTTQEISPLIECLRELGSAYSLPPCFHSNMGLYDPKWLRQEALVLHDTVEGPQDWDEHGLRQSLQRHYGPNASIVRMNGILPQTAHNLAVEETSDIWGGGGQCGNCLSHSDRVMLRKYLATLLTSSLLPALERRISDLNVIVSDRKKGVRNVLKSFWRKPKEQEEIPSKSMARGEVAYRYESIESQTRLLADTLFLIKDYEAALGMYRLIRDDYKHDKAMMHYASVQEMISFCMYFMDPYGRAKEIFANWETALLAYSKAADDERPGGSAGGAKNSRATTATHATRMATRLCLLMSATEHVCTDRHLEVADLLASASSHETALGAAVLLEQSSAHYYHAEMYRKYAFHMLMSGHMFRTANQEHHAFRCFTSALYVYRDGNWSELHNHLRSALAAQLYSMGRMAVSVQLYAKLVGIPCGGSVSIKSQQKFVNNLLSICNEHTKTALVGADRMVANPKLIVSERDRVRKERFDQMVDVIRFTRGAQRVLELPYVRLPTVYDKSLVVEAAEEIQQTPSETPNLMDETSVETTSILGDFGKGLDNVWNELKMTATAELKAADAAAAAKFAEDDEVTTKALARIEDKDIRRVIAQIDKEKKDRALVERNRRSSSYKGEQPPVRARLEPLTVRFSLSNPLNIPIDMEDMQIVARITSTSDQLGAERVFTNEEAIEIPPQSAPKEKRTWNFASSGFVFEVPQYCRLAPQSGSENKAWTSGEDLKDPSFVVSKHNVNLAAQGSTSIALGICPLMQGDLVILGVRSRLFDDVWVYHPFDIKGHLLHNTRHNRATRVRADPVLLKATIKEDMPCLTVGLIPASSDRPVTPGDPFLQGQITSWILRLSNVGTAPATNITLKTNLPWINIPSVKSGLAEESVPSSKIASLENEAISCCVGPSGTLIKLPLRGSNLKKTGSIHPGESVDVPIQIRTCGKGGKQDFYMLYRYELEGPTSSTSRPHRWLRRMYNVPVCPSVLLSATVTPSYWNKSEHLLSVELTNYRADRPNDIKVMLEKLSLSSRRYRMERLKGQFAGNSYSDEKKLELDWQEQLTVHYLITPLDRQGNSCLLSDCPFGEEKSTSGECVLSSEADYLCLEKASEKFESTWKYHQVDLVRAQTAKDKEDQHPQSITSIRKANSNLLGPRNESSVAGEEMEEVDLGAAHPTSLSKLFPAETSLTSINLMCSWTAGNGIDGASRIRGETHLHSVLVRPFTKVNGCPITVTANHPTAVTHVFEGGPATVPFEVIVKNQLVATEIEFDFEVEQPPSFDFVGAERLSWKLRGGEELAIPIRAIMSCPGVYNLQTIRVLISDRTGEKVPHQFPQQWMLTVCSEE